MGAAIAGGQGGCENQRLETVSVARRVGADTAALLASSRSNASSENGNREKIEEEKRTGCLCPLVMIFQYFFKKLRRHTPIKGPPVKKPTMTSVGEGVEKWEARVLLVDMETGPAAVENDLEAPQNTKNRTTV